MIGLQFISLAFTSDRYNALGDLQHNHPLTKIRSKFKLRLRKQNKQIVTQALAPNSEVNLLLMSCINSFCSWRSCPCHWLFFPFAFQVLIWAGLWLCNYLYQETGAAINWPRKRNFWSDQLPDASYYIARVLQQAQRRWWKWADDSNRDTLNWNLFSFWRNSNMIGKRPVTGHPHLERGRPPSTLCVQEKPNMSTKNLS